MHSSIASRSLEIPAFVKDAQVLILQYGELPRNTKSHDMLRHAMRSMNVEIYPHDTITGITIDFTERTGVPNGYDVKLATSGTRGVLKIETTYTVPGERLELYGRQYDLEQELFNVRAALNEV
jgi:hypothetical protein